MRVRAAAVVIEGDEVLVIDRVRGDEKYCVLPGGGVECDESPEQACLRELREETGLEGEIMRRLPRMTGRSEPDAVYFEVRVGSRKLRLGDPELHRNERLNRYEPTWREAGSLARLVPASAREAVRVVRGDI